MWTTREGKTMKISDMTDDHLCNTILYLSRRIKEVCSLLTYPLEEKLKPLEKERERRGLPTPLIPIASLEYRNERRDTLAD